MPTANTASATPRTEKWSPALLSSEAIFGGTAVRLKYEDGITVVASKGPTVTFEGETFSRGARVASPRDKVRLVKQSIAISMQLQGPPNAADVEAYERAGRSPAGDAIAAGHSPDEAKGIASASLADPPIWASGCTYSDNVDDDDEFDWNGCFRAYFPDDADPNNWYGAVAGEAYGWGTGVLTGGKELSEGWHRSEWRYQPAAEIIEASPPGSVPGQNCDNFSIGLSQVIGLGFEVPLRNDRWRVSRDRYNHRVQWEGGSAGGPDDTRYAGLANTVRVPNDSGG